jgi:hypothetical protein
MAAPVNVVEADAAIAVDVHPVPDAGSGLTPAPVEPAKPPVEDTKPAPRKPEKKPTSKPSGRDDVLPI